MSPFGQTLKSDEPRCHASTKYSCTNEKYIRRDINIPVQADECSLKSSRGQRRYENSNEYSSCSTCLFSFEWPVNIPSFVVLTRSQVVSVTAIVQVVFFTFLRKDTCPPNHINVTYNWNEEKEKEKEVRTGVGKD